MVNQHLQYATFAFGLLLSLIHVLSQHIANRVCRLELEWQRTFGEEDPEQHLHETLQLLCM